MARRATRPINRETQYPPASIQAQPSPNKHNDSYDEWMSNIRAVAKSEFRWSHSQAATIQDTKDWRDLYQAGLSPRDAFLENQ